MGRNNYYIRDNVIYQKEDRKMYIFFLFLLSKNDVNWDYNICTLFTALSENLDDHLLFLFFEAVYKYQFSESQLMEKRVSLF